MRTEGFSARSATPASGLGRRGLWVLALGLLVDLAFIQLHRLYLQGVLPDGWSLANEAGYSEHYQHAKELAIVLLARAHFLRRRDPVYVCWLGLFTYLFLDDSFQVHERLGGWIAAYWSVAHPSGLRATDIGELIVSGTVGLVFFVSLAAAWRRSTERARQASRVLIGMLLALAFFGIIVDTLDIVVTGPWHHRLGIIEDGGEMMAITTILWFLYAQLAGRAVR